MPDFTALLAAPPTLFGVLLLIVIAFMREWIVPGVRHRREITHAQERYDEMRRDRDQWRSTALAGVGLAEKATAVAEQATVT